MKNIRILYLLVVMLGIVMVQSCQTKENKWTLLGITPDSTEVVYLYQLNSLLQKSLVDSAQVTDGKFTLEYTNPDEQLMGFVFDFSRDEKGGIEFLIANGDRMKVNVKQDFESIFSGTSIAADFNKYNAFRNQALIQINDLREVLAKDGISEEEMNETMLVYKEKMQELENEKIDFIKTIQNPELNSFLILNEILSTGVIEKELFGKYVNALTAEGAMTNEGHKIHQIYDVIDAFSLSREIDILDTATVRERFNQLDEINKDSEFGKEISDFLNQ